MSHLHTFVIDIQAQYSGAAPPIPIFLDGENRLAKVLMPMEFTDADIDRVIKVLAVYKKG